MKSLPSRPSEAIINSMNNNIGIDWAWVKKELIRIEKIPSAGKGAALRSSADVCLGKAAGLSTAKTVCVKKNITDIASDHVTLEDGITLSSKFLSSYLSGAKYIQAFVVTIGKGPEDEASRLMNEGDSLNGYFLDRIGSLAVESVAESFENRLRGECKAGGLSLSRRLSPGYCDWPIEEQFKLAKLIDFSKAGVKLTDSCMMIPKKSISAVAGIGPKGLFTDTRSQCVICSKTECGYRRLK